MQDFKGLKVPPADDNISKLRLEFCNASSKCIPDCRDCLFDGSNITQFQEWYKTKFM